MRAPRYRASGRASGRPLRPGLAAAVLALGLFVLPALTRAEIVVKLEITAEKAAIHLEPNDRSPVVETLARGTVIRLSSPIKFRTNWYYVLFTSSRSGRMLTGYVPDTVVRKLNSTIKVVDLTPAAEIADPPEVDLTAPSLPEVVWGVSEGRILRSEGRPLSREQSGDMEFLRYHRDIFAKRCLVTYVLIDAKLASIRLHLLERYANKDRYVADYNRIKEFLNSRVGEPRYDNIVWKDRAYAERGEKLGTAVMSGSLSLSSEWTYRGTGVRLSLTGENNEVLFVAEINDLRTKNPASF